MPTTMRFDERKTVTVRRVSTGYSNLDAIYGDTYTPGVCGLPLGATSLWAGAHGCGKTRLLISMVTQRNARSRGRQLYFQNETPADEFAAWFGNGIVRPELLYISEYKNLEHMLSEMNRIRPELVIVDSVSMVEGWRSDSTIEETFDVFKKATTSLGAHAILVSQLTKDGTARGSTIIPHLCDIECAVEPVEPMPFKEYVPEMVVQLNLDPRKVKLAMHLLRQLYDKHCEELNGLFRVRMKKNRYGESGGIAGFHHTGTGVEPEIDDEA